MILPVFCHPFFCQNHSCRWLYLCPSGAYPIANLAPKVLSLIAVCDALICRFRLFTVANCYNQFMNPTYPYPISIDRVVQALGFFFIVLLTVNPFGIVSANDPFQHTVLPFLKKHCVDCHTEGNAEGGVDLDRFSSKEDSLKASKTWLRVWDALESGVMPPSTEPRPSLEVTRLVVDWIESDFLTALNSNVGQLASASIRRLNRQEYNNTIRDLLGINEDLAKDFPSDEISFGYDNNGSALSVSPIHIEKYLLAAERATSLAVMVPSVRDRPPVELIGLTTYPLAENGSVSFEHHLAPGKYMVDFSLVRVGVAETVPTPTIFVSFGEDYRNIDAVQVQDETLVYRFWIDVAADDKSVTVRLASKQTTPLKRETNKEVTSNVSGDQRYGGNRGLHVDSMVVRGPVTLDGNLLPASHHRIVTAQPELGDDSRIACGHKVLADFVERAFRRPAADADIAPVVSIFEMALKRGESFERAIQIATTLTLVSPKFLFHAHSGDDAHLGDAASNSEDKSSLDEYVLANRLSYFLWSSMPDEELLNAAQNKRLRSSLASQLKRLLADDKSQAFVVNFVGQWLQLRKLADARPDPALFQGVDAGLIKDMRHETEAFVGHVFRNDCNVLELLDSDYTFASERLAKHYGLESHINEPTQGTMRRTLGNSMRGGLLTHASILTLTSNPNRTSPVKRGGWILEHLLGSPPPPPPPNVPPLDEGKGAVDVVTLREKLELHRVQPDCAACHNQMDPLGFALENFDAIGRWRDFDGSSPVDATGKLSGGRTFKNANDLKQLLLATESKRFSRCLIENLLTYALGRGLEASDYGLVESIRKDLARDSYRVNTLIMGIVTSVQFQESASP